MDNEKKLEKLVETVEQIARGTAEKLDGSDKLKRMFQNCFVSTAKTTTKFL